MAAELPGNLEVQARIPLDNKYWVERESELNEGLIYTGLLRFAKQEKTFWLKLETKWIQIPNFDDLDNISVDLSQYYTKTQIENIIDNLPDSTLDPATSTTLGGVKVGDGLSVDNTGKVQALVKPSDIQGLPKSISINNGVAYTPDNTGNINFNLDLGNQQLSTPYTPAALIGSMPIWLDLNDTPTVTVGGSNYISSISNKGDLTGHNLVNAANNIAKPIFSNNTAIFNASPMVFDVLLPVFTNILVLAIVELDNQSDTSDIAMLDQLYGFKISQVANKYNGYIYQNNNQAVSVDNSLTKSVVALSRLVDGNITRLSSNGGVSSRRFDSQGNNIPSSALYIGGFRASDGSLMNTFKGKLRELLIISNFTLEIIRKLEGYCRVRYNIPLPVDHPYYNMDPIVEDIDNATYPPYLV